MGINDHNNEITFSMNANKYLPQARAVHTHTHTHISDTKQRTVVCPKKPHLKLISDKWEKKATNHHLVKDIFSTTMNISGTTNIRL